MNREDFQQLAESRLKEARALLTAELPDGAYYLAGYAIECALKACIAKRTQQHDLSG
jgi:HEPN domain-containing protein